jgi:hypothetical protein
MHTVHGYNTQVNLGNQDTRGWEVLIDKVHLHDALQVPQNVLSLVVIDSTSAAGCPKPA